MAVASVGDGTSVEFQKSSGFQALKTEDFVRILVAQLSNQNPLQPLDDNQLLQQVSAINSLSASGKLVETLNNLSLNQGLGAASSLIGRQVTATVDGRELVGVVDRVVVEKGEIYVVFGENKVSLGKIQSVGPAASAAAPSPTQEAPTID
jgi:flagellar basal-body rod modification protein FlgD